ncbi:MAG TPA: MBL fold metallo-hydrolase [Vicinamibacterales bacterium]|nr:MBL fold metallo-hydrolase [Vicinamibacterales bacterium]
MRFASGALRVLAVALAIGAGAASARAQAQAAPDHPSVTVRGQVYTPRVILGRNMGSDEDQTTAFTPHRIIDNIYYVGTRTLTSFLIVTPQGNILINSTYERNVPVIQHSVEQLGFKFTDIKVLLGNHAHGDHQEGDALVKSLTGAQVVAMTEDVPDLLKIMPGGKAHPIDRMIHDGDTVTLGETTLTAHLTAGHTRGCTTWTMKARDSGRSYDVMFGCSLRAGNRITPENAAEFRRSFTVVRALPCDVQLGDHGAQFGMPAKFARLGTGGTNPYIDPAGCKVEMEISEAMVNAILAEQAAAPR